MQHPKVLFFLCCLILTSMGLTHRKRLKHILHLVMEKDRTTTTTTPKLMHPHLNMVMAPENHLVPSQIVSNQPSLGKEYGKQKEEEEETTTTTEATVTQNIFGYGDNSGYTSGGYGNIGDYYRGNTDGYSDYSYYNGYNNPASYNSLDNGVYNNDQNFLSGNSYNEENGYLNYGNLDQSNSGGYDNVYSYSDNNFDVSRVSGTGLFSNMGLLFNNLFSDPGSILLTAAAMTLNALVLNLILVATNRTGGRRKKREVPVEGNVYSASDLVDVLIGQLMEGKMFGSCAKNVICRMMKGNEEKVNGMSLQQQLLKPLDLKKFKVNSGHEDEDCESRGSVKVKCPTWIFRMFQLFGMKWFNEVTNPPT